VHRHIKVRKSSAFISMQRAWRLQGMMLLEKVSRDDASYHKKQSIFGS
jgi:hypothetical protein